MAEGPCEQRRTGLARRADGPLKADRDGALRPWLEGQKAIGLDDTTKGGTLYVATTGVPFPLEITKTGKESGKVVLDRWNKAVTLSAPPGAIDISTLQKAG